MSDVEEQQLLFGTGEGEVSICAIQLDRLPIAGGLHIAITVHTHNRHGVRRIDVYPHDGAQAADALDIVQRLQHKAVWCREGTVHTHMKRALDALINCGAEVKESRVL